MNLAARSVTLFCMAPFALAHLAVAPLGAAFLAAALLATPAAALLATPAAPAPAPPAPQAQEDPFATTAREAPPEWQQGVEYRIEARLDEEAEVLQGRARVRYRNNSPHTLDDFWLHLYLNAFRPNSLWARNDLELGITTFQELGPDEHAFERIRELWVEGRPVELVYPFAPDSTIVGFELPEPLEPGGTVEIDYTWDARPSTEPRRQGRRGRQWDFAQWYPRVVVYDDEGWRIHPLYRQGEFYGEFATYDVTVEVREDQVIGATGVPVEGDPGWSDAAAPGTGPVAHQREWYGSLSGDPCIQRGEARICNEFPARRLRQEEPLGMLQAAAPAGFRRVRWFAEDVHHFAWSTSPEYIYEQGTWEDVVIRVLYRPGDEEEWGGGTAVRRTAVALEWTDSIFGEYPYPQVTNLHRIEGGGTEFPMLIMDGSASQSLILHEVGHIYAHGILANNEWYEGWLDEGLSSFQTSWFFERAGEGDDVWRGSQLTTLLYDLQGVDAPVVMPAEDYAEYGIYSSRIYTKGSMIFLMLREMAGEDRFIEILRTYYERNPFQHVDTDDLKAVAEEVLRTDLDWFFGQWLHTTGLVDYALRDVEVERDPSQDAEGEWRVMLDVERVGDFVMPVPVRLTGPGGQTVETWLDGWERNQRVAVRAPFRPERVELDPDGDILDWNVRNNHWTAAALSAPAVDVGVRNPLRPVATSWRQVPVDLFPLAWFNDAGGWVAGLQMRTAQLGLVNRATLRLGLPAVEAGDRGGRSRDFDPGSVWLEVENPVIGVEPRLGRSLRAFAGEGRLLAALELENREASPPLTGPVRALRASGTLWGVYDEAYLVPGQWTPETKLGVEVSAGMLRELALTGDGEPLALDLVAGAGYTTRNARYLRGGAEATLLREAGSGWRLGTRLFAGGAWGRNPGDMDRSDDWSGDFVPRERMFFLAGAGPLKGLRNPWLRSAGSPLDLEGRLPGGGGLPGFDPGVAVPWIAAANVEVGAPGTTLDVASEAVELRPVLFAGLGTGGWSPVEGGPVPGDGTPVPVEELREDGHLFYSGGVGLELGLEDSPIRFRVDVPFLISDPELATDARDEDLGFRWTFTISRR